LIQPPPPPVSYSGGSASHLDDSDQLSMGRWRHKHSGHTSAPSA